MINQYLFHEKGELCYCLENFTSDLKTEILSYDSEYLLNVSVHDLVQHLVSKYSLLCPNLDTSKIYINDQNEVNIDVSQDRMRDIRDRNKPFYIRGTEISIAIPFTGDSKLFHYQPTTYSSIHPVGVVAGNEIIITVQQINHNAKDIKQAYQKEVNLIQQHLAWIENDINKFNQSLEANIKQNVETRKSKIIADKGLLADIGLPIKRRNDAPQTYSIPLSLKKPNIKNTIVSDKINKPEPTLDKREYENILSIIFNMVMVMERSPRAFSTMQEEDLRQHFLVQLNGQYKGQATGETFNYFGKTDILIRVKDKNVFIAECKFWEGEKSLISTIDQLLNYSSWRDTKIAILLFNRKRNFSQILEKIPKTVKTHSCFKSELETNQTKFQYLFHMPDDKNRELILSILAFNIPTKDKKF